jgi:DNA mismatch repair protein MutS2
LKKARLHLGFSSHFEGLKAYALSHEEITNASMVFDEEKLLPTYKLKMGLPGESYGLVVAKRFCHPGRSPRNGSAYMSISTKKPRSPRPSRNSVNVTKETEDEKALVEAKAHDLEKEKAQLESEKAALKLRQDHYLSDVEEKKNELPRSLRGADARDSS